MDAAASQETIIIVHGTWASPEPGTTQWYQPSDKLGAFTAKLDHALLQHGSSARCWAHCCDEFPIFKWSGENNWVERMRAASDLKTYVDALQSKGWLCHIIAHSHGGNIAIDAFADRLNGFTRSEMQGKIVTLGTPFLNSMASIKKRNETIRNYVRTIPWLLIGLLLTLATYYLFNENFDNLISNSFTGIFIVICTVIIISFISWQLIGRNEQKRNVAGLSQKTLLSIGSVRDEAWQVLHHLSTISNPLSINMSIRSYIADHFRQMKVVSSKLSSIYDEFEWKDMGLRDKWQLIVLYTIDAVRVAVILGLLWNIRSANDNNYINPNELFIVIFGAAVLLLPFAILALKSYQFTSAYLSLYRFVLRLFWWVITTPMLSANYYLRPKAWLLLQKTAMGLEGYRFGLPTVEQAPSYISQICVCYENLPEDVERRALARRSAWITRHFGDITDTFAKLTLTAADLTALLREIEVDQSLVHGAYYTDDECIALIAQWISNDDQQPPSGHSVVTEPELLSNN